MDSQQDQNAPPAAAAAADEKAFKLTAFSDEAHDSTFHFQILHLTDQDRTPSVAALLGGGANSTGASMARRLSMRTGWSIVLASSLPSNSPTIEAFAEQRLFQELKTLGYVKPISKSSNRAPPTSATKLQA